MASPLWVTVYIILCIELVFTALLIVPKPKVLSKALLSVVQVQKFVQGLRFIMQFICLALALGFYDSIRVIGQMQEKIGSHEENLTGVIQTSLDRERLFRAQRNLYLTSFTLMLVFVNMRLVQLLRRQMQLHQELEDTVSSTSSTSTSAVTASTAATAEVTAGSSTTSAVASVVETAAAPPGSEVEMQPVDKKTQ